MCRKRPIPCLLLAAALAGAAACGGSGGEGAAGLTFRPAALVVGQPDFGSNESDHGTVGPATATGLTNPGAVTADGTFTLIADTFNNRILGFAGDITTSFPAADFVIGQTDFGGEDAGLAADRLDTPRGVCLHAGRLYVADTENHRVLIWATVPQANQPADWVLGQVNFTSKVAGSGPAGFTFPNDVTVAGGRLYVADALNNRVLVWDTLPAASSVPADRVLGQPDLVSSAEGDDLSGMTLPRAVWGDAARLVVADAGNCRVMIWNTIPTTNGAPADVAWGQWACPIKPGVMSIERLSFPGGVASDGARLFVADTGFHRVLVFDAFPDSELAIPDAVLGQSDFDHTTENDDDQDGVDDGVPTARTMHSPVRILLRGGRLHVPEFMNHRVTIFEVE